MTSTTTAPITPHLQYLADVYIEGGYTTTPEDTAAIDYVHAVAYSDQDFAPSTTLRTAVQHLLDTIVMEPEDVSHFDAINKWLTETVAV